MSIKQKVLDFINSDNLMWVLLLIILILCLTVIKFDNDIDELTNTTTTTSIEFEIAEAQSCIKIDPKTFPFEEMTNDGFDIDYNPNNTWSVNNINIGVAEFEDETFSACGPVWLINTMEKYNG